MRAHPTRRPERPLRLLLLGLIALLPIASGALEAQARLTPGTAFIPSPALRPQETEEREHAPAKVFLFSLVLPGAGQYALGQRRWIAYVAAEAVALGFLLDRRGEGLDRRGQYRDLAWETARSSVTPRVDPKDFEYYERLSKWTRSGAFDADPASAGLQPETDPSTYNGSIWALAAGIFLPDGEAVDEEDPRYRDAVSYYAERAYPDPLGWDWSAEQEAQRRFRELIHESDDAFRQATVAAALLLTNHVLSATDAFVAARLGQLSGGRVSGRLRVEPRLRDGTWGLTLSLSR